MQRTGRKNSFSAARPNSQGSASPSTIRATSATNYHSTSSASLIVRPRNSVRNEIITLMFDNMLKTIVKSWKTLEVKEETDVKIPTTRTLSDPDEKKKFART